jgi:tetratricopeptide (TPR) repeat protein
VLANAYADVGYLVESGGDPVAALAVYRRAEALSTHILDAQPGDARATTALVKVWSRMARALAEIPGRGDEASRLEEKALDTAEKLAATRPKSADAAWTLMLNEAIRGAVAYRLGDAALASSSVDSAIATGERILAEDPENAQWRYDLALCYMLAGNLAAERDPVSAFPLLGRALELAEPLAARDPADVDVASVVALSKAGLGVAHAGLARSAGGAGPGAVECLEARRWLDASGPELGRLERLQTLNGWKRWLAGRTGAEASRCPGSQPN